MQQIMHKVRSRCAYVYLQWLYHRYRLNKAMRAAIDHIFEYNKHTVQIDAVAEEERAFPANPEFLQNNWCKIMFARYLYAAQYCSQRTVLDLCCGLGWGAFLLSHYARQVTAVDISAPSIEFARKTWKAPNVTYSIGDALNLVYDDNSFDVVLAFEAIEHFSHTDGHILITELARVMKHNGVLVISSSFPSTREKAEKEVLNNPYHYYIYTYNEIKNLLGRYFRHASILGNLIAVGKGKQ